MNEVIKRLRELGNAATQGPFEEATYEPPGERVQFVIKALGKEPLVPIAPGKVRTICMVGYADGELADQSEVDVQYITALLNAAPKLMDMIDALEYDLGFTKAELETSRGASAAQDERERVAGKLCGVPYEEHGCDWPDAAAEKLVFFRDGLKQVEHILTRIGYAYDETKKDWVQDPRWAPKRDDAPHEVPCEDCCGADFKHMNCVVDLLKAARKDWFDLDEIHNGEVRLLDETEAALKNVLEPLGECDHIDHSGNCQSHSISNPCEVKEARAVLDKLQKIKGNACGSEADDEDHYHSAEKDREIQKLKEKIEELEGGHQNCGVRRASLHQVIRELRARPPCAHEPVTRTDGDICKEANEQNGCWNGSGCDSCHGTGIVGKHRCTTCGRVINEKPCADEG